MSFNLAKSADFVSILVFLGYGRRSRICFDASRRLPKTGRHAINRYRVVKSRSKELLDRSLAAAVAAIEIYNKPDFVYREEAFAVLAINGWELLLKAKWLVLHHNKLRSLFVSEVATTATGLPRRRLKIKKTRSNNPFTHSLDWLAKKLIEQKHLDVTVWKNLEALMELRDCSVHFYNRGGAFSKRLQEVGSACLKNYVTICHEWFKRDLREYNFYLMPLSFVTLPETEAVILNPAERKFLTYVDSLEGKDESQGKYSVAVNIEVRFTKSKAKDALAVIIDHNDPNATVVRLTEEQIRERWKWDYAALTKACRERYSDFVENNRYHKIRKALHSNPRYVKTRHLDPGNPRSAKKHFFEPNILQQFDKHYKKKVE